MSAQSQQSSIPYLARSCILLILVAAGGAEGLQDENQGAAFQDRAPCTEACCKPFRSPHLSSNVGINILKRACGCTGTAKRSRRLPKQRWRDGNVLRQVLILVCMSKLYIQRLIYSLPLKPRPLNPLLLLPRRPCPSAAGARPRKEANALGTAV